MRREGELGGDMRNVYTPTLRGERWRYRWTRRAKLRAVVLSTRSWHAPRNNKYHRKVAKPLGDA